MDKITVEIGRPRAASVELGNYKVVTRIPNRYEGEFAVTPTNKPVVLATSDKYLAQNVIVNPIPSDWGHISYDGAVLTVS